MAKKYMEELLAQIREKHAKERVRQEIESHILEQKAAYMAQGLPEDKAEEKAVIDMGDPVLTGTELDLVHKPRPAWGMLALAAVLCAAGVILQYALVVCSGGDLSGSGEGSFFRSQSFYALLGFFVLCIVYLIDYTWIAKYSRWICTGILLLVFLLVFRNDSWAAADGFIKIFAFGTYISLEPVLYLYIPAYGALLYSYRNGGRWKRLKAFLYFAAPIYLALQIGKGSLILNLSMILCVLLFTAAAKGWLRADHLTLSAGLWKKFLSRYHFAAVWGTEKKKKMGRDSIRHRIKIAVLVLCTAAVWILIFVSCLKPYQLRRFELWMHPEQDCFGDGYVPCVIRSILNGSRLIGSDEVKAFTEQLPHMSTDYMVVSIIGHFGILAAVALVLLILMFAVKLLQISVCQSNQLGMIMGLGCSLLFFVQSAEYILVNLTILPTTSVYLPLISYSGGGMIQTCGLVGILLSIYRYQDVVPEPYIYSRVL